jgi:hypothetical protein
MCLYEPKQFMYHRKILPKIKGFGEKRDEFFTCLPQNFQKDDWPDGYLPVPLPFLVLSINAATLACNALRSGSWAYTIWPDV